MKNQTPLFSRISVRAGLLATAAGVVGVGVGGYRLDAALTQAVQSGGALSLADKARALWPAALITALGGMIIGRYLARSAGRSAATAATMAERLQQGDHTTRWGEAPEDEFRPLASAMDALALELTGRAEDAALMRAHLPEKMIAQVLGSADGRVEPARRDVVLLCCDLRALARFPEGRPPAEAGTMAEAFLGRALPLIEPSACHWEWMPGGTLLIAWGLFNELRGNDVGAATTEGLRVARALMTQARELSHDHNVDVGLNVGLHLGPTVLAGVASGPQLRLTLAGDAVTVAVRLAGLGREMGVSAVASEEAVARLPLEASRDATRYLGESEVPGRLRPVRLHLIERERASKPVAVTLAEPRGLHRPRSESNDL